LDLGETCRAERKSDATIESNHTKGCVMQKFLAFIDGKKTYIIAIGVGICAGLQAAGIDVPEYVYILLGALGLGAIKSAVKKTAPTE